MKGVEQEKTFTLPSLANEIGAQYRTLQVWVEKGILAPSLQVASGTGTRNLYSERDVRVITTLVALRDRGLDIEALEAVAAELWKHDDACCPICDSPAIKLLPTAD